MKTFILSSIFIFSISIAFSQSETQTKSEKKAQKQQAEEEQLELYFEIVNSHQFIVEATSMVGNSGETYTLSPSVNFFYIDSSASTIQLSFEGLVGWNGLGGVTIDGKLDRFQLDNLVKGKPVTASGNIIGRNGGNAQFVMYVNSSGMATVELSGNWSNNINFNGRLLTLAQSKVYKGVPLN
jgi:hypothetical protein